MSTLEISEMSDRGEHRWGISLISDEGVGILKSLSPLAKGAALASAKSLKHKGPDASLFESSPEDLNRPAWIFEKQEDTWVLKFTLVTETPFEVLTNKVDSVISPMIADEKEFEAVRYTLTKAEIKWNPPEADPAYIEKQSDMTPTVGIPGSW